jgi:hypothetical protein
MKNINKKIRELENIETKLNLKIECVNKGEKEKAQLELMSIQDRIYQLKEKRSKIEDKKRNIQNECYYY